MSDRPKSSEPAQHGRVFWILAFLLILGLVLWIVQPFQSPANGGKQAGNGAPVPVVAAVAQKAAIDITEHALGTVTPLANVTVRAQISGQLMEIAFQEGQMVKAGDFLAQIDPRPYQMALEQAEGNFARDEALAKEAQLNLARYKKLVAEDSIARQQLDTQQSLVDQYIGTLATDRAQINSAKLNLAYCHITAPVAGRVGLRQVDQGNYVQVNDTNGLVTIAQLQPITVLFTLPEDDVPAIMKRISAGAELQVTAFDRTQANKLATGRLSSVDNQIDVSTGTVKLRAQFDNTDFALFPNQFVNASLLVDTLKDVVTVPSAAVQRGAPGTFVYLIKDDNTVTVRAIKIGPAQGDMVAVLDGLSENDKVVTDGGDKLREGAKVALPNETRASDKGSATDKGAKGDDASAHRRKERQ
ncbi:MAG: MdtA/MuxA family multidrug efflux RND transporter periplasmic adaptor subunit [Pseudomonadota bacterium]|nr:MdtA/MuxA family multidrug efflux RND transporter periplasmic adaptor subunit [Pseudomonadota bacterium]